MSNTLMFLRPEDQPLMAQTFLSEPDGNMEFRSDSEHSDMIVVAGDDAYKPVEDDQPIPLMQAELNNLTGDLNLSKESA